MKHFARLSWCFVLSLIIWACATVPTLRVPQPWIRSLKSEQAIRLPATVKVEVSGTTAPLLGNEQLAAREIREILSYLMTRRGFSIQSGPSDYVVQLLYKTERSDKFRFSSSVASTNTGMYAIATSSGAGATSGLGVSIARAVSAVASRSATVSAQTAQQVVSYTHTLAIELRGPAGDLLWKGESAWDSDQLDLIREIIPAIQLVLSDLPMDNLTHPKVGRLKESHAVNFYKRECEGRWFTCPALPYRIMFADPTWFVRATRVPEYVGDEFALAAYVDLVQTAEYALPSGDTNDWKDPTKLSLWEEVSLGGQYLLGGDPQPVNILIELRGQSDGYLIWECKVASDEEFNDFSARFSKWREVLRDYYDWYLQ
ncbi:MAG: hypothetical protein WB626_05025 [Bacteroidota bacterium]